MTYLISIQPETRVKIYTAVWHEYNLKRDVVLVLKEYIDYHMGVSWQVGHQPQRHGRLLQPPLDGTPCKHHPFGGYCGAVRVGIRSGNTLKLVYGRQLHRLTIGQRHRAVDFAASGTR